MFTRDRLQRGGPVGQLSKSHLLSSGSGPISSKNWRKSDASRGELPAAAHEQRSVVAAGNRGGGGVGGGLGGGIGGENLRPTLMLGQVEKFQKELV